MHQIAQKGRPEIPSTAIPRHLQEKEDEGPWSVTTKIGFYFTSRFYLAKKLRLKPKSTWRLEYQ
jgi:hypothetical protein